MLATIWLRPQTQKIAPPAYSEHCISAGRTPPGGILKLADINRICRRQCSFSRFF
jgi:hypothetical protein